MSSSLFTVPRTGPVRLTQRGVVVFWGTVVICLGLNLVVNLSSYPLEHAGAVFQAVLGPLANLPFAVFVVAPAVVGRTLAGGERQWGALSGGKRALMIAGGLVAQALIAVALYHLGAALDWRGGGVF